MVLPWVKISHIDQYLDQDVELKGWVYQKRVHGKIGFIELRDGTGFLQIVVREEVVGLESFQQFKAIYRESSVILQGTIKHQKRNKNLIEMIAHTLIVIHPSKPEIDQEVQADSSPDILLDKRHLVFRGERSSNILKCRSKIIGYFHDFMRSRNIYHVTPPTIVSTFCEGGSDLFKVDYFKKKAFLTQSSQLYLESAIFSLGNVYSILPSYRAEKSRTPRHIAEYTHLEVELSFAHFDDLLDFIEDMIIFVIKKARKEFDSHEVGTWELPAVPEKPFIRMTYREAINWLNEHDIVSGDDVDITALHERKITEALQRPIFLTHFPSTKKPFYHKRDPEDSTQTLSVDLLLPVLGEVVGGGERSIDLDNMLRLMKEEDAPIEDYYWYTDLRKYGSVPHVGFGLGIERFVQWLLSLEHIRETVMFPRTFGRVTP